MKNEKNRQNFEEKPAVDIKHINKGFDKENTDLAIFHVKTLALFLKYY